MAKRGGMGAHHSARVGSDDWITPKHVLEALGKPFDLDPCASLEQPWLTAMKVYTVLDDGLSKPWEGEVWLNPPYSNSDPWIARLAHHEAGMALIFARTETATWFEHIWEKADSILFLQGRLTFHRPGGETLCNAGAPSALVAYGHSSRMRLKRRNTDKLPGKLLEYL